MQSALQPYATAGVAIVGASLIAVTPVTAPLPDIHTVRDVALTSTLGDLLGPFIDQYNTAADNATQLINNFSLAPGVALQQFLANQAGYIQDFFNDPSSITDSTNEMQEHLRAVLYGLTLLNADPATVASVTSHTLSASGGVFPNLTFGHDAVLQLLPLFLPPDQAAQITPIIDFFSSPLTGIIIGELGPVLSPVVALINSINDGDSFTEILANTIGAFFNGATIDLDSLIPAIGGILPLPAPIAITHLDFALGGLLSPGAAQTFYQVYDSSGNSVADVPSVGGSIFNSLGLTLSNAPIVGTVDIASQPIGPIGAWEAWGQAVSALLGSGWDGKRFVAADPPLTGVDLPIIPNDFFDDGGAGATAAADSAGLLQEILAALGG